MAAALTTILMLSANPKGTVPLRLDEERREIEAGLERSRQRDQFRLITKGAVRPQDVQRAMLDYGPQVVHFSGHGEGEPGSLLEDGTEQVKRVEAAALASLFELFADRLWCVVLNACYSEVQAEAIAQHIPYVIGMSDAIGDKAAIVFAVAFYDALGAGREVEFAYNNACVALKLEGIPAAHIPVLHRKSTPRVLPRFSAYDPQTWTGRDRELADLTAAIAAGCRVVLIHGMTGIGKTALAERLAAESLGTLSYVQVVLDRGMGSVAFTRGALAILEAMADETAQQLADDQILDYLLKQLWQTPLWLQLDSVEYLLQPNGAGQPEFADPAWGEFLERVLRDRCCQSRLILTTQALPKDLLKRIGRQGKLWRLYPLEGLEVEQYLTLFKNCGVSPQTEAETNILCQVATYFEGHPYILEMIARDIVVNKPIGGNITKYWQDYWLPRQQQNIAPLSQEEQVRGWVNETLAQLPDLPRQLLQHGAVFRRAVTEAFYLRLLPEQPATEMAAALALLKARALVQETDIQAGQRLIQQHNLICDAAYNDLQADPPRWHAAERQAAHLWLTAYEPAPDANNLEIIQGYLEAAEHYFKVKDYQEVIELADKHLETGNPILYQLFIWGYFNEEILLSKRVLESSHQIRDYKHEVSALCNIGKAKHFLGSSNQAIIYFNQQLTLSRKNNYSSGERLALNHLG